jgi:outer membrane receptor protein involved in Fe transport
VTGVVKDQNGASVAGADVTLFGGTAPLKATTDNDGRFAFESTGFDSGRLEVRARGFSASVKNWSASETTVTVTLAPEAFSDAITVTASRTSQRVSDTPASVVLLSNEDFTTTAALTLDDKLRQVPGFSLFRRTGSRAANPTAQGVSLRGVGASGASRAVVMNDGIPLNDPFGGWIYWGRVPRESVERVEVVQGGQSNLYGSDALGGAINLLERSPRDTTIAIEASMGNETTPETSMFLAGRHRGWGGKLGFESFYTDGYILVDDDQRGIVDTKAGSFHQTANLAVERLLGGDRGRVFAGGGWFQEERRNGTPLQTNQTQIRELRAGFDWQSPLAGSFAARGYGGNQVLDQDFSAIAADRNSETLTRSQRVPAGQSGFTFQWSRAAGPRQTLVAGVDGRQVHGASDELVFVAGQLTSAVGAGGRQGTVGVFLQDLIQITPRWLVTLGFRQDRWNHSDAQSTTRSFATGATTVTVFPERTETAFNPRASIMYRASDSLSLFVSGYRAFRAPTLNELYRAFRVGNVLTLANSNLQAERLTGGETGASVDAFKRRLNVRGTFFWSEITRPVANVTLSVTPTLITRQRQNLGRTRSRGVEIESEARIGNSVVFSAGYQFLDATVVSFPANTGLEGLWIPQVPRHLFTFQARYSNRRLLTLALQGRASSKQFDDDQNLLPLDPYFTLDAMVSRDLGYGMEVFGALENLTGQRYEVGRTPVTTLGPPLLGRVGLRFTFPRR